MLQHLANSPRSSALIAVMGLRCLLDSRNLQFCALRDCGAPNMNGLRTRQWPRKPASNGRPLRICVWVAYQSLYRKTNERFMILSRNCTSCEGSVIEPIREYNPC